MSAAVIDISAVDRMAPGVGWRHVDFIRNHRSFGLCEELDERDSLFAIPSSLPHALITPHGDDRL